MPADDLRPLPKAVLHDHLDGDLRVDTILELAEEVGYTGLPTADPEALEAWFYQGEAASLDEYLEAFVHTVAVLQTPAAVERAAFEAVADLAADGVVYAELRFAPALLTRGGMTLRDAMGAAVSGAARGEAATGTITRLIIDAMRQDDDSEEVARAVVELDDPMIVGFDLAGPEAGFPASGHLPALRIVREAGLGLTIHAGEQDGPSSMWDAWARGGAQRLGHGFRIIEDTKVEDGEIVEMGRLAEHLRDTRTPLEICISSNLHTWSYDDPAQHPVGALYRAGFNVTLNTDNRLMSATSMTNEMLLGVDHQGLTISDLGLITEETLRAGFGPWPLRRRLIEEVVRPAYASATT